ncbi:MAG: ATP-binding protein [Candidatus Omnitrophica bacterium]|nr:ATP-binding protein [Candidatus Omnitrophota bacterium]
MLTYYITSLLTTITCLGLGVFVLCKNTKNPLHRSLFRLNLAVALWSFFLFLHYSSKTMPAAMANLRLLQAASVFIPSCYLHFIINLLGIKDRKPLRLSYFLSVVFLFISFTPLFVSGVEPKLQFRFYATAGPLYLPWIITYIAISGYGIYLMLKNYNASPPLKKNQIRYVLLASLIGFAGGATIYPLFYNIPFPPVGEHIIFLYPFIFALAVLKHNILDLKIVIKRTVVYSLSVILITLTYLIVVLLAERLLRNIVGYQSLWSTVIAAICIALLFNPLKNRVQALIEKIYIKSAYQRFKKELLESDKQKALAQLAAGMAHEIRNPLTAIKTFSEFLPEKFDDAQFREKFSRIVTTEVNKIDSLITQLIEFAKPSALNISPTDIHGLTDYTLDLLSSEVLKHKIKLIKHYTKDDPMVEADANKLRHVLFNIIKNAIEAIGDNGTLTITTRRTDRFVIEIADTGGGITQDDLNKIFEPFFSTKEKGAGLGLAVVQGIVAEHNATISVKSTLGSGTTFILQF